MMLSQLWNIYAVKSVTIFVTVETEPLFIHSAPVYDLKSF